MVTQNMSNNGGLVDKVDGVRHRTRHKVDPLFSMRASLERDFMRMRDSCEKEAEVQLGKTKYMITKEQRKKMMTIKGREEIKFTIISSEIKAEKHFALYRILKDQVRKYNSILDELYYDGISGYLNKIYK
jgi:hypothetical protein